MVRADSLNLHVDPVRTEMTGGQQILISYVFDSDESESKEILADENLSQVCSTDKYGSENVIVDESSMEKSEPESIHKSINKNEGKYAIDVTEHEEHLVKDNPAINDPRYFKLFECGKYLLNRIDVTFKRACMATSRYGYYIEMYNIITDYNDCNKTPLLNENIR